MFHYGAYDAFHRARLRIFGTIQKYGRFSKSCCGAAPRAASEPERSDRFISPPEPRFNRVQFWNRFGQRTTNHGETISESRLIGQYGNVIYSRQFPAAQW